jgi:hypothetical protein
MVFPAEASVHPDGHPFHAVVGGTEYLYFANGYPFTRVPATVEDYLDPGRYEAFTPLRSGSTAEKLDVERDQTGRPVWGWKRNAPALTPKTQQRLVRSGRLAAEDALLALRDVETGKPILGHNGSVYWNEFTRSWLMIISEEFGTSMLGEVWLAEAESPVGPWIYARKIVSHDAYSFYNPKQHPYFSWEGGRIVRFEGTYTMSFSGNSHPTPRYEYNQIMYEVDLGDPRLDLPRPVRGLPPWGDRIGFHALPRRRRGSIAVYREGDRLVLEPPATASQPIFHALPAEDSSPATRLLEEVEVNGRVEYRLVDRSDHAICRVWGHPLRVEIPLLEKGEPARVDPTTGRR